MKAEKKGPLTPVEGGLMRIKSNVFRLNFFLSLLTDFFILAWAPSRVSADANESIAMKTVSLSSAKLNWGLSLTGKVLAQPLKTRDGYIAVCEGNTVVSFTQGGKELWRRDACGKIRPLISNGHGGMLYLVSGECTLSMLRPDGSSAWTSDAGFPIEREALAGRDGRVYAFGNDQAACFGTRGTRRWTVKIPSMDEKLPPVELNDGTLAVFGNEGGSIATISPFGETGQTYSLPCRATDAMTSECGALIGFSDGSAMLVTETDGKVFFDWKLDTETGAPVRLIPDRESGFATVLSGNRAIRIETKSGRPAESFETFCGLQSAVYVDSNALGLVVSDGKKAVCYTESGGEEWISDLNQKTKWSYVSATDDGHLFFCTDRWTIESYRVKQIPTIPDGASFIPPRSGTYSRLYGKPKALNGKNYRGLFSDSQLLSISESFGKGGFGTAEKDAMALLTSEMNSLEAAWAQSISQTQTEKAYLASDMDYAAAVLSLASDSETEAFQRTVANLIRGTTDAGRMERLVKAAGEMSLDPDYLMLDGMDKVVQKYNKADTILALICDSTVRICSFMGREAFDAKGRSILTAMMGNRYSLQTRTVAMESLEKLRRILDEQKKEPIR
ncbi:MAG: hypothetical protein II547_07375 [Treponema sp.]|nr:hypothetical protein [Treponema sp.]